VKKTLRVWIQFCIWIGFDLISGSGLPQNLISCLLSAVFSVQNFTKSYSQCLHIPVDRQTASTVDGITPLITVYAVITIRLLLLLLHQFNTFSRTTWVSWHQKGKPFWTLLEQDSGISWTICKSFAPHSRQTTMPAPHHSVFTGWMPFLSSNQQRQSTEGTYAVIAVAVLNCRCIS